MPRSLRLARCFSTALVAVLGCKFDASGIGEDSGVSAADGAATTGSTASDSTASTASASTGPGDPSMSGSGSDSNSGITTDAQPSCRDGKVDPGEQCDAGADNPGGLDCTPECKLNVCGDAYIGAGEACDAGPDNTGGQTCTANCELDECGDGYVGATEGCDDGPANGDGEACTSQCKVAGCGDGIVNGDEECDDANFDNSDDCIDTCKLAFCGDSFLRDGEKCDLGGVNGTYGSDCNATCDGPAPRCGDGTWDKPQEECDGDDKGPHLDCRDDCTADCEFGWGNCNMSPDDGCEANLWGDEANCGECGNKCPANFAKCDVYVCHP